jgi:P27 family predicted phage terminase small subunit
MGNWRSGRKPKSPEQRAISGGRQRDPTRRAVLTAATRYAAEVPPAPNSLVGDARREWDRVVVALAGAKMVTAVDLAALAVYCGLYARLLQIQRLLNNEKRLKPGSTKWMTAASMERQTATMLGRSIEALGLSPAARGKVVVSVPVSEVETKVETEADRFAAMTARLTGRDEVQ